MSFIFSRPARAFALAATLAIGVAAAAFAADTTKGTITVEHPWARASAGMMAGNGAAFMTITNSGSEADRLVSASSPVAEVSELHTHLMEDGVMKMRQISGADVDPGTPTVLKPGGMHVMLIKLKQQLKEGETFPITLTFQKAGAVTVQTVVTGPGAMDAPMGAMHH